MSVPFTGVPPTLWQHDGRQYDCVYSPDDGGYYVQRHSDNATSQIFHSAGEAWEALTSGEITWDA